MSVCMYVNVCVFVRACVCVCVCVHDIVNFPLQQLLTWSNFKFTIYPDS